MKCVLAVVFLLFLFSHHKLNAAVVQSSEHGFKVSITHIVNTSSQNAYSQFIKVNEWWDPNHTWFGDSNGLYIEQKVGGCFCEVNQNKQALHMTVSYVVPNSEIRMIGGLGPLQMLGITGGMSWSFNELSTNKTKIIFDYQVTGFMQEGLKELAPIVNQVQSHQIDRLVAKLNN